jgi:hypothetical protein
MLSLLRRVFVRRPKNQPVPLKGTPMWLRVDVDAGMFTAERCVSYPPGAHVNQAEWAHFVEADQIRGSYVRVRAGLIDGKPFIAINGDGYVKVYPVRQEHLEEEIQDA